MREQLIAFLKALEAAIPPAVPLTHHPIFFASDLQDGTDRLALSVNGRVLFLDDGDLEKPVDQLVRECCAIAIGRETAHS